MIALLILASTVAQPALAQPVLNPLAPFVGHCWSGDAPGGAGTDTHCFEAAYGGQHVRDRHAVKVGGKAVYAGETIYSVEQGASHRSLTGTRSAASAMAPRSKPGTGSRSTATMREEPSSATEPMHAAGSSVRAVIRSYGRTAPRT